MEKNETNKVSNWNLRSEEVQAIVDRMPTHWTQWVALCVSTLMGLVILLGFVIQYPDTVDGNISVTANAAPIRLVSKDNGRLILLTSNRSMLHKGDVIAYIDNGANYQHLLQLEKLLQQMSLSSIHQQRMPDTLILGNISSVYNNFMFSYQQYQRLLSSDIYATMRQSIQQQIISDEAVIKNINQEIILKQQIIKESRNRLKKDSILLSVKGISDQEYQNQYTQHLNLQESHLSLNSSRQIKLSEINHNKMEMQRIFLEESEAKEKNYADLMTKKNELFNAINLWKERYLMVSPIEGELEYLGFWRNNYFVQAGQELFTVMPDKNSIVGEVQIPSFGAGKVKIGQTANVKIDNFPYDEYGLLKGKVKSISRITNKLKTQNGDINAYLVVISFPNGLTSNFGKLLPLDFETKGTVEIITKPKKLIERLFDNLKARGEK